MNPDFDQTPVAGSCPAPDQLRNLLDESLSPDDEAVLSMHLQQCPRCQQELESLPADSGSWSEAGKMLSAATNAVPPEEALVKAVARLEGCSDERQEPDDAAEIGFLAAPRRPGSLGSLDHYDVLSIVGRGGMGIVFKAHDTLLERVVAVKVMAAALAASAAARQRFIREAQAAAAVAHEHVVTIHAVEPKNIPYLVMQLVAGVSLEQKIRANGPLEVKEILRIGMQTAAGLAAAHAQGLIHRDVKPANILLENGIQRVKITDFGLARLVDDAGLTQTGVIAGTPQYMSPEQVRGERLDGRSDLFSLGSVLYAMCTGQAPFGAGTSMAVLRKVSDEEPSLIGELNPEIPPDLVAVIKRLHCKDPAERYQSAAEVSQLLADQLARLQSNGHGGPNTSPSRVAAPPVDLLAANLSRPRPRRPWKVWQPLVVAALAFIAGVYHFAAPRLSGPADQSTASATGAGAERPLEDPLVCVGHIGTILNVVFSPDAATLVSAGEDRMIHLWDTKTGQLRRKLIGHEAAIRSLAISPDGRLLASSSNDGAVRLWNMTTGEPAERLPGHEGRAYAVAFSPDGRTLASAGEDRIIRLRTLKSGEERTLTDDPATGYVRRLAFSPDGSLLASAGQLVTVWDVAQGKPRRSFTYAKTSALGWDSEGRFLAAANWLTGLVTLFNPTDGRQMASWLADDSGIEDFALWPERDLLFSVGTDGRLRAWDLVRQQLRAEWPAQAGPIAANAVAPQAGLLATGGKDGLVKLWNVSKVTSAGPAPAASQPQPLVPAPLRHTLSGHTKTVKSVCFSPDGGTLATAGNDSTVRLWDARTGASFAVMTGHQQEVLSVAFSPDGTTLASSGGDERHGEIMLWDRQSAHQTSTLAGHERLVFDVAFSPNGKLLAACSFEKWLGLYELDERKEIATLDSNKPGFARRVLFADDGHTLLTCGDVLSVYDVMSQTHRRDVEHKQTSDMKLSPQGDLLAVAAWQAGTITLYDFPSLQPTATWRAHRGTLQALSFSPHGDYLASSSDDGTVRIWQVAERRLRAVLLSPRGALYAVAFSPEGATLAATNDEPPFDVYLWNVSGLDLPDSLIDPRLEAATNRRE